MTNQPVPTTNQIPPRRRVQLLCPEQSITDPDESRSFSMTNIKKRLDQGIMTNNVSNDTFYSLEPLKYNNLQDALNFHQEVTQRFEALPLELRKAMGHNIHNFEPFIKDPANAALLKEHGLIVKHDASNQQIVDGLKDLADKFNSEPISETPPKHSKKPQA